MTPLRCVSRPATVLILAAAAAFTSGLRAQSAPASDARFTLRDIFELEWAVDPQISPDGTRVAFVRSRFDILKDRVRSNLWIVNANGTELRPLVDPDREAQSPRWSPDGMRLAFLSIVDGKTDVFVRWMDSGQQAKLTHLEESPADLSWSPDGKSIAFTMFVPDRGKPFVELPVAPDGADWGPPIKFIDQVRYRDDAKGYLRRGYRHIFVLSADGETPRQLTDGPFDDGAPVWAPDRSALLFPANRHDQPAYEPEDTEICEVPVAGGPVRTLTTRKGPDRTPAVSPDGKLVGYTGFDDRYQGYQVTHLYVMNRDGSRSRVLSSSLDRDVTAARWSSDGKGLFFLFDDQGTTKIGYISLAGDVKTIAPGVGGLDLGRPYGGTGSFTVSETGRVAFTQTAPDHPADVAVAAMEQPLQRLTRLNDDVFAHKTLGSVEEFWFASSFDKRRIQGWIIKPPGFDPHKKYPLVLEIHGGPFMHYGTSFTSELQLYAASGYVVLYMNPRGSTSYGEEFGNLTHHDYPNHDYEDLMAGVDAVIGKGSVDPDNLFVTGGSGGGILTAWIVGHTNRFRAAAVQKPIINWFSGALTTDDYVYMTRYWFPSLPWEDVAHYMKRSPIAYVGNVTTPTMLLTGELDYRAPSNDAEQFYAALKLRRVATAMVRFPDAGHDISERPSNMMAKVAYIIAWFEKYRSSGRPTTQ